MIEEGKADIAQLQGTLSMKRTEIDELQERLKTELLAGDELESTLAQTKSELEAARSDALVASDSAAAVLAAHQALQSEVLPMRERITLLEASQKAAQREINASHTSHLSLEERLESTQNALDDKRASAAAQEQQLASAGEEVWI